MTVSKKNMFFEILKTDRISLCLFCVNSLYSWIIARGFQMTVVELLVWKYGYLYVSMVINAGSSSNSDQNAWHNWLKEREKSRVQCAAGFGFAFHWLKNWWGSKDINVYIEDYLT